MRIHAVDTHKFISALIKTGFTQQQARILIDVQQENVTQTLEMNVASKEDIHELDKKIIRLEGKIEKLDRDLTHRMDQRFAEVDQRFASIDKRFTEVKGCIDKLSVDMNHSFEKFTIAINGKMRLYHWMFGFILLSLSGIAIKYFM